MIFEYLHIVGEIVMVACDGSVGIRVVDCKLGRYLVGHYCALAL